MTHAWEFLGETHVLLFELKNAPKTKAGPAPQPVALDPVKLSPQMYTLLLENEHVRVLEFRCKPGEKEPLHSHPAMVAYSPTASKVRDTPRDGETVERETKPGTAVWVEAATHSWECLGPGEHITAPPSDVAGLGPFREGTIRLEDENAVRAVRTVLNEILSRLTAWLAPVLVFTAEEAWRARPWGAGEASVHAAEARCTSMARRRWWCWSWCTCRRCTWPPPTSIRGR